MKSWVTSGSWPSAPTIRWTCAGRQGLQSAAAVMPAYVKSHSQGEYVFDHGWAAAWERAGGDYYPKLQIAVPFTPVPGRRLLTRDPDLAPALIGAAEALVRQNGLSSAHATFIHEEEVALFEAAGYTALTPGWPDDPETVEEANAHPEVFAHKTVGQVADHYDGIIRKLNKKPAVVGHSFGGLLAQILAGRGLSMATVAITCSRWF